MTLHGAFDTLIALHITTGAPGLLMFWVPVLSRKGGERHKFWGRLFTFLMLATGAFAASMASLTLLAPMQTHPQLVDHPEFSDPALVRGIFGHMMLYLAILTVNLAWYGWLCVSSKTRHEGIRSWHNFAVQLVLALAATNCFLQGLQIGQPMMMGIAFVGFATVGTNLWFMLNEKPRPIDWLTEHIKAHVGTGISVYTAFFAFGAVRLMPELALAPALWAAPLVTGLSLILYHQRAVTRRFRRPSPQARASRRSIAS